MHRLAAVDVKRLPQGRHADGAGLYLTVTAKGRSWIFRWRDRTTGKLRDHGLGPAWDVSLADARTKAKACRELVRQGGDPIAKVRQARTLALLAKYNAIQFNEVARACIAAMRPGWRNAKHAAQWESTLTTYCKPIWTLPIGRVDTPLVLRCLEPHWADRTETMTRVRQRIETVLDYAIAHAYRPGPNPARWKGCLDSLLPKPTKVKRVQHRAALEYIGMHAFMVELRALDTLAARALEFQILTATRPGEACGAQWDEIDLDAAVWTIPATRMKAGIEHRVPLSAPAVALLVKLQGHADGALVFPGTKGKPITTAATVKLLKAMRPGLTSHGFRSSFRDWAGDATHFAREVIEECLAHRLKNKAESAYRRGDALARRRVVMDAWAAYIDREPANASVTPIRRESGASR